MIEVELTPTIEVVGISRAGKGTFLSHLKEVSENLAIEGVGEYYRKLTLRLCDMSAINAEMSADEIVDVLSGYGYDGLMEIVEAGIDAEYEKLYSLEMGILATNAALSTDFQNVQNDLFKTRLSAIGASGDYSLLAVDGRGHREKIKATRGLEYMFLLFMTCRSDEQARRQAHHEGVDISSERGIQIIQGMQMIEKTDTERSHNQVVTAEGSIGYSKFLSSFAERGIEAIHSIQQSGQSILLQTDTMQPTDYRRVAQEVCATLVPGYDEQSQDK